MKRSGLAIAALLVGLLIVPTSAFAVTQRTADLAIEQPHYIDGEVSRQSINGTTVYEAEGERLLIAPQNFSPSDVVSFGVEESEGQLSLDEDLGVYTFQTSQDGTYHLYWTVEETRIVERVEGNKTVNETETVKVQYNAVLRVEPGDRRHVSAETLKSRREAAANWKEWKSEVLSKEVAGPNASIETQSQLAIDLLRLRHHPLSALTGKFSQILLTLFITLGGLLVLLLFGVYHYATRRSDIKFRHERESLDAERADLEEQLLEHDERERLRALEGMDWNDIFPDDVARAFREAFGETVLDGYLALQETLAPSNLIRDRLEAMHEAGYVAVLEREDVATDGGDAGAGREVVEARIAPREDVDEDQETMSLEEPSEELLAWLEWDDSELRSFDLPDQELDQSAFDTALRGASLEELIEEYDVDMRQFDGNKELYAEYLLEFVRSVENHEFTDSEGRIRPIRYVLNLWLRTARLLDEKHETPLAAYQAEHIEYLLANYDRSEEIASYVEDVEEGKHA